MSKETQGALSCPGCGQRIQFFEQHVKHCAAAQIRKLEALKQGEKNK